MICGALSTLNEDAFEDVTSNQNPNSTTGSTGELILQQNYLAPITEEFGSPTRSFESFFDDANQYEIVNNNSNNNINRLDETTVIIMPNYSQNIDDTRL